MAQQDDGWPLGLRLLNARLGLLEDRDFSGSISFNTLPTGTFTDSSDLDSESASGSFFQAQSITVGDSTSMVEVPRRWLRKNKSKSWLFSLCSKLSTDAVSITRTHFLDAERRTTAASGQTS